MDYVRIYPPTPKSGSLQFGTVTIRQTELPPEQLLAEPAAITSSHLLAAAGRTRANRVAINAHASTTPQVPLGWSKVLSGLSRLQQCRGYMGIAAGN